MSEECIGSTWLRQYFRIVNVKLSHESYLGTRSKIEIRQDGTVRETFQMANYALRSENPLGHFEFALKYDNVQIDFFRIVLKIIPAKNIIEFIKARPNSKYSKKIGFWYELLTKEKLPVEDRPTSNYVDLIDPKRYITGTIVKNIRWRINDNLLGNADFCPVIRRTDAVSSLLMFDFSDALNTILKSYPPEILKRAANYLYKKETRSSYQIEKEEPSPERIERFVSLLSNAGRIDVGELLSEHFLVQLQNQIVDPRFAAITFRDFQNYIGQTAANYDEIIHYVCPPPQFLTDLIKGLRTTAIKMHDVHPIIRAAAVSFGFVFMHPFEDGNGRIHRFLIHDILSRNAFLPAGMIIPVSAHMVTNLNRYDEALEAYSGPLMKIIRYSKNAEQELIVLNPDDIEGYYRFPDLTFQTEYLFKVVETSVSRDLPDELVFLQNYDEAKRLLKQRVDMPDKLIDLFIRVTHQNNGIFPKRKKIHFQMLEENEIEALQSIFQDVFNVVK